MAYGPISHRFTKFGADRIEVKKFMVNTTEVFDLNYLYVTMHEWLVENGWCTRTDSDFNESYFLFRDDPKVGKEYWIRWRLERSPEGARKNKLFTFMMDVDFHILFLQKTEIVHKGQKLKMDKGEVEVEVASAVIIDKEGQWKKSFLAPLKELYVRRIRRAELSRIKKELLSDAERFHDAIASYLKLETYLGESEGKEFWSTRTRE